MIKIFISYADEDVQFRGELETHLAALKGSGRAEIWHRGNLLGGSETVQEIQENLKAARVVVMLASPDYEAGLQGRPEVAAEFNGAMELHRSKSAHILPVVIREYDRSYSKIQLSCVCEAKPVSAYRKDLGERDSAWKLVIQALIRVCDGIEPRPDKGAVRYDGAALPYLCNREMQERTFIDCFYASQAPAPQAYFLPGPSDEAHTSFVKRICGWTFPEELSDLQRYDEESIVSVTAGWVEKAKPGGTAADLRYVIRLLDRALKDHPKLDGRILVVEHSMSVRWWDNMAPLLRDYLEFWKTADSPRARQPSRAILFFHILYPRGTAIAAGDKVLAELDGLTASLNGEQLAVARLDPLEPVLPEHVDIWINTHQRDRLDRRKLIDALFSASPALPMESVVERLTEFVNQE